MPKNKLHIPKNAEYSAKELIMILNNQDPQRVLNKDTGGSLLQSFKELSAIKYFINSYYGNSKTGPLLTPPLEKDQWDMDDIFYPFYDAREVAYMINNPSKVGMALMHSVPYNYGQNVIEDSNNIDYIAVFSDPIVYD